NDFQVDERTERLICRSLDGALCGEEQVELDAILSRDAAARAMFDDYAGNDRAVASALKWDFETVNTVVARRPARGWWLAVAGAGLAAAAVVALSFVAGLLPDRGRPTGIRTTPTMVAPTLIDYRDGGGQMQRVRDLNRDVIGIPGRDGNTIY